MRECGSHRVAPIPSSAGYNHDGRDETPCDASVTEADATLDLNWDIRPEQLILPDLAGRSQHLVPHPSLLRMLVSWPWARA